MIGATETTMTRNALKKQKGAQPETGNKKSLGARMKAYWQIYVLMGAGLLAYILFRILPLWGLSLAFVDFNIVGGIFESPFVGFQHFIDLFTSDRFFRMLRNTLGISLLNLFVAFPAPIILALLLNEVRSEKFKRLSQSIVYMPHFLSWPVIAGITFFLFSIDVGVVNKAIVAAGGEAQRFLTNPDTFWFVLLIQNIWREIGWGSIIYLAALSQIDPTYYEAATVDGATRVQQLFRITLPCLMPTITVMFIMRLGSILDVSFEQVMMMDSPFVSNVSEVFDLYSFQVGMQQGNYSIGTAVGLCKSVVGLILVIWTNWLSKKAGGEGLY